MPISTAFFVPSSTPSTSPGGSHPTPLYGLFQCFFQALHPATLPQHRACSISDIKCTTLIKKTLNLLPSPINVSGHWVQLFRLPSPITLAEVVAPKTISSAYTNITFSSLLSHCPQDLALFEDQSFPAPFPFSISRSTFKQMQHILRAVGSRTPGDYPT